MDLIQKLKIFLYKQQSKEALIVLSLKLISYQEKNKLFLNLMGIISLILVKLFNISSIPTPQLKVHTDIL